MQSKKLAHGSVFSGIGGFDLAAQQAGFENVFYCEQESFGLNILEYYWPQAVKFKDIRNSDFTIFKGLIDVLSGGFPCQDASNAKQDDSRNSGLNGAKTSLFYEMCRVISEVKPPFVVLENVSNILRIDKGSDFKRILSALSQMGYNAEWRTLRASDIGAPHHRERLYMVAYSDSIRMQRNESFFALLPDQVEPKPRKIKGTDVQINAGKSWLCEPPVYIMDDGLPDRLDLLSKSIHAVGNAVVPQLPYYIFSAIKMYLDNKTR